MRVLEIPNQDELITVLERAAYEVSCRNNIINFMIQNGLKESDSFKEYWEEYLVYFKAYEKLKYEFSINHVKPNAGKNFNGQWEVNFHTKEIILHD